ncbi:MAG: Cys-tRNA(Pro) deacylase [Gammaproteobacteria bacterium]|nr:Cys-tRNA(Pro) deacylase [Gammaproteobacteria bacterium]
MTPAVNIVRQARLEYRIHEYTHDAGSESYGLEAAEKLGVSPQRVFKTLVVSLDNASLAVAVVPVCTMLGLKAMARAAGAKKAVMAAQADVERATGYVLGGVSPLGQKKRLKTVIDESARNYQTVYVSAGRRGLEIELAPDDLGQLVGGIFTQIGQSSS